MAGPASQPEAVPPRPDVLEARIRTLALNSDNIRWRAKSYETHVESRLDLRDVDPMMMYEVLRTGYLSGRIRPGKYPDEWTAKMTKKMRGKRELGVVTIVVKDSWLFVKTVEWEDPA